MSVNTLQLLESSSKKSSLLNIFLWQILIIKPTRGTNFLIYLWNKTLHVSDSFSVHHQEFFTVQTAVPSWSCSQAVSKPVWHTPLLSVQWKTPDDGQRNCPKHVEFYSTNKCEELVHLVGFIIRIYHDVGSPERHIFLTIFALIWCVQFRNIFVWNEDQCLKEPAHKEHAHTQAEHKSCRQRDLQILTVQLDSITFPSVT